VAASLKAVAGVAAQDRVFDPQGAGAVVAHKEDRPAALAGVVVLDQRAGDGHGEVVAVGVYRATAATAGGALPGRVGSVADRLVVAQHAVEHYPRHPDAAERAAVRARPALARLAPEGAAHHVDRPALVLAEDPDRGPAEVRAGGVAPVAYEPGVDHFEPAASHEDRPASAALGRLAGGVAVGEGEVLHGEPRVVLVLAV